MTDHARRPSPRPDPIAAQLTPFVAWLATKISDESTRSRYRRVVECYLRFVARDSGAPGTRRARFVVAHRGIEAPETTRAALALLTAHDEAVRLPSRRGRVRAAATIRRS